MRLDKMLANSGYGTRSEVRKLITRGLVRVNGNVVKDIAFSVFENDNDGYNLDTKRRRKILGRTRN